jgi:hypothetical protein
MRTATALIAAGGTARALAAKADCSAGVCLGSTTAEEVAVDKGAVLIII